MSQKFAVVLVPADDACLMEELSLGAADVEEQVSMVTTYAKAHFEKLKSIASLSEAERAAQHSKMRSAVQKNHPGAVVSDEQMAMLSMMNLVDTVPLQVNKLQTKHVGVNLYVDDQGEAKQLPINKRASAICAAVGRDIQVRGDAFISRFFDNDDVFERRDFQLAELADSQTDFFVSARKHAMPRDQEPAAKSFSVNPAAAAALYAPAGAAVKRCGQGFLACEKGGELRCARCKDIWYCSAECQKLDWKRHKAACAK